MTRIVQNTGNKIGVSFVVKNVNMWV